MLGMSGCGEHLLHLGQGLFINNDLEMFNFYILTNHQRGLLVIDKVLVISEPALVYYTQGAWEHVVSLNFIIQTPRNVVTIHCYIPAPLPGRNLLAEYLR